MMKVTGEEGVSIEDYVTFQQAQMLDMVYLQQDAFDEVDVSVPRERQKALLELIEVVLAAGGAHVNASKPEIQQQFVRLTGLFKNLNYSAWQGADYQRIHQQILQMANS